MGRVATFDSAQVVRAARDLFWAQGYEAASIPELEQVTGLKRSSLYHAFGSKRGLFDAAVDSYLNDVVRPRLKPLQADNVPAHALIDYLSGLRDAISQPSMVSTNGCLLVNAANSPIAHDSAVRQVIQDYRNELSTAMHRGVTSVGAGLDSAGIESAARTVTALVITAFTLARTEPTVAAENLTVALDIAKRLAERTQDQSA